MKKDKGKTGKKRNKKKIIRNVVIGVLLFLTVGMFAICAIAYSVFANSRMQTPETLMPDTSNYPDLDCTNYTIPLENGNEMAGYLYSEGGGDSKGLVILSHGLGVGGHITYIDVIDVLAANGYEVFAYDAEGCDNSTGKGFGGFTEGVKDLDAVISYVEEQDGMKDMPILLWGHSWGAWNVMTVAYYHPEVCGIAALSGYSDGMQPMKSFGVVGAIGAGYVGIYNRMVAGSAADLTAIDGLNATDAPVFIAHGTKDLFVSADAGYYPLYNEFSGNGRFTFILRDDRMHLDIYSDDETSAYRETLEAAIRNSDTSGVDKEKYYGADSEMMREIIVFYNRCVGEASE